MNQQLLMGFVYGVGVTSVVGILAHNHVEKTRKKELQSLANKSIMATEVLGDSLAKTLTYGDFSMAPDGLIEQITTNLDFTNIVLKEN